MASMSGSLWISLASTRKYVKVWLLHDLCGTSYIYISSKQIQQLYYFSVVCGSNMYCSSKLPTCLHLMETIRLQSCYLAMFLLVSFSGVFVTTGLLNYYTHHLTADCTLHLQHNILSALDKAVRSRQNKSGHKTLCVYHMYFLKE